MSPVCIIGLVLLAGDKVKYKNPYFTVTGTKTVPVRKSDRSKIRTGTGTKSLPELVRKIDSNVSLTNHKRLTGENIIFSHVETTPEKPVEPLKLARVGNCKKLITF
jgi:hypothetical protein